MNRKKIVLNVIQNVVFWMISFTITLQLFSQTESIRKIDVIYCILFHIPFVGIVSLNIYHLIPNILNKENIWVYILMITFPAIGVTWGMYYISYDYISVLLFPDYYMVATFSHLEIMGIMYIYLFASTSIELSKTWFNRKETELRFIELERQKTKSELKALRAQINPHFLFNNLNTIYGEALKKSESTPDMILKLSSILRYIVENMDKDEVELSAELSYLREYVDLHKKRLSNPHRIFFKAAGDFGGLKIAPLLLVNFVENCFKHGSTSEKDHKIEIKIDVKMQSLHFSSSNVKSTVQNPEKPSTGTGIANSLKRLDFLYPNKHKLTITETDTTYSLELKIDLA